MDCLLRVVWKDQKVDHSPMFNPLALEFEGRPLEFEGIKAAGRRIRVRRIVGHVADV